MGSEPYVVKTLEWQRSAVPRLQRWFSLFLAGLGLYIVAVLFTKGSPTKLYLGADNRYSSSKFQVVLWFWVVVSAYLAVLFHRISAAGWSYIGGVDIPQNLLILSGTERELKHLLEALDVREAQRVDLVQRAELARGVPPAVRERAELGQLGRIDVLVSNASALSVGGARADWERSLSVDLMGAVRLVDAVLPGMRAQADGAILLVSSVSAIEASPMNDYGYTAAKAALNAYAKKLAVNEAANGIRANALLPGSVEFPGGGWDQMRTHNRPVYDMVRASIPFGRLGTPEEIADAATWLVSARASWVTGAALSVDGGQGKGIR